MSQPEKLRLQIPELRLPGWHRRAVYVAFIVVAASGVIWTLSHDLLNLGPNALERFVLRLHAAGAFFTLAIFGSLIPHHIRVAWIARRNRASGALIVTCFVVLAVSAYGLYYIGEDARGFTRWLHIAVGVLGCAALPAHIWLGRHSRV